MISHDTSTGFKHNIGSILVSRPNKLINSLEMRRHADLPIGVVCFIEEWWFARTMLYISNTGPDTEHVWYAYQTRLEITDLLPDTSGILDNTKQLWKKNRKP
jgi:hypothetical protein